MPWASKNGSPRSFSASEAGVRRLAVIELGEADLRIRIDHGLLVDAPDALQRADIEGVLGDAVARALAVEFAIGFLLRLGLLHGGHLGLCQDDALLSHLGLQRLQPLLHVFEIMA